MGVVGGVSEERGNRAEVADVEDQGDLDAASVLVHSGGCLLERGARARRGRLVGKEHVLDQQVVAGRVAVGTGGRRRRHQRGERHDRGERRRQEGASGARAAGRGDLVAPRPRRLESVASNHSLQVVGWGWSMRSAVVGVPPGTAKLTMTTAGVVPGFLTMNAFAAVS